MRLKEKGLRCAGDHSRAAGPVPKASEPLHGLQSAPKQVLDGYKMQKLNGGGLRCAGDYSRAVGPVRDLPKASEPFPGLQSAPERESSSRLGLRQQQPYQPAELRREQLQPDRAAARAMGCPAARAEKCQHLQQWPHRCVKQHCIMPRSYVLLGSLSFKNLSYEVLPSNCCRKMTSGIRGERSGFSSY